MEEQIGLSAGSSLDEKVNVKFGDIEVTVLDMDGKEMTDSSSIYFDLVDELRHAKSSIINHLMNI